MAPVTTKVLFVIAEMAPLVKVGGLGDVGGALPRALREAGVDARVAMPLYGAMDRAWPVKQRDLPDGAALWIRLVQGVPVYLIEHEPSFDREAVYGFDDDAERFLAFGDALLAAAEGLDWLPDVVHLHDWHPAPVAMRLSADAEHLWKTSALVCTVHNVVFDGPFDKAFVRKHKLDVRGDIHTMLSQALLRADAITTVSPTHAKELLDPKLAGDIATLLAERRDSVHGILNGLDTDLFDPANDEHLAATFDGDTLDRRVENKGVLQARVGLPQDADVPVAGIVSRFFWQKGIDLAAEAIDLILQRRNMQFVALGRGDPENEEALKDLAGRYPDRVAVSFAFDDPLSRLIYGGSDLFLMPSRYEPGGIGQLIAMRYGSVPVVRRTGGLADSVSPHNGAEGTGFLFDQATAEALASALDQALDMYRNREAWQKLQSRGMSRDFSWSATAEQYRDLYGQVLTERTGRHDA